jgi:hypothetical protein
MRCREAVEGPAPKSISYPLVQREARQGRSRHASQDRAVTPAVQLEQDVTPRDDAIASD